MVISKTVGAIFVVLSVVHCHDLKNVDDAGRNLTKLYKNNLQQMVRIIDPTTEACDNFYRHACGNYEHEDETTENEIGEENDNEVVPPFLYNKEDRMHFFHSENAKFKTRPGIILAQLYEECKARSVQHVLSTVQPQTHWKRMLSEVPWLAQNTGIHVGWPYLQRQWVVLNRQHEQVNWMELAAVFAAHGVPTLLDIYFADQTIFIAAVQQLYCPSLPEMKRTLASIVHNMQIAHAISHELLTFCRSLHGELPLLSIPVIEIDNSTHQVLIDENIVEYFQHFFTQLNFTEKDIENARKLPVDVARISVVLQLLHESDPRIIYNFIIWQAYEALRYEDCYLLTEEFERLLHAEYWQWHVFQPYFGREVALAMYLYHTTRFQQQRRHVLMGKDWYRFLLAPMERKDFNIARTLQEHARSYLNITQLTDVYKAVTFKPGAFYWNLLQLRHQQLRLSYVTSIIDIEDLNHPAYFLRKFLHFCILILKQPLYHYYATQGFELWQMSNLLYDTDGYYTALDCLDRQSMLHYSDAPSIYRILSSLEVTEIFNFYRSFVESQRDYRFWLEGESFAFAEDFVLEYFKLDSKRILFYSVAQLYCNRNDLLYATQINRSYMNMQSFQEAFNCSIEAPMNPVTKCMTRNCD